MTLSSFSHSTSSGVPIPTVIALTFELVRGTEDQVLNHLLPRVKRESVALDLSKVERIDAAGIAALITLYRSSAEAGTDFSVVASSHHVTEMLCLVGLQSILVADASRGPVHELGNDASRCSERKTIREFSAA